MIADLLGTIADAYESLGKTDAARDAWKKTAAEYKRRIGTLASSKQAYERGYNLERAYALWKSGETAQADELYRKLEARYPAEFTFFFAHAKMNLELKRYPEAQAMAERALQYSYGDNRLRVAETLAKAMKAQDHKSEARAVIRDALVQAKLPDDASIRTHRYANALRKLEKELAGT
jgi:tetratricopeptide (TPR) repeat protein